MVLCVVLCSWHWDFCASVEQQSQRRQEAQRSLWFSLKQSSFNPYPARGQKTEAEETAAKKDSVSWSKTSRWLTESKTWLLTVKDLKEETVLNPLNSTVGSQAESSRCLSVWFMLLNVSDKRMALWPPVFILGKCHFFKIAVVKTKEDSQDTTSGPWIHMVQ